MSSLRRFANVSALLLTALVAACADKVLRPQVNASPRFTLQLSATTQRGTASQKLLIAAVYFSSARNTETDSFRILDTAIVASTGSAQQVTLNIDLTNCLADGTRRGSRDGCSMYILAALLPPTFSLDTSDVFAQAVDYKIAGPFDAAPGRAPTVPAIDLSMSRFDVSYWESDEALRLGGAKIPLFFTGPITGAGTGATSNPPTLFAPTAGLANVATQNGQVNLQQSAQLAVYQNGVWRRVIGPIGNVTFNDVAAFSPTDVYIAASDGLYHYDGTSITAISAVREAIRSVAVTGANASAKYVVAGTSNGGVWFGNTTTWTRSSTNTSQIIDGVCVTGPTEAFAANRANAAGGLFRFDGTTWTSVPASPGQSKVELQCPAPGQAYVAVQGAPSALLRWTGSTWTQVASPVAPGRSFNFGVVSPTEIYAVGDSANVNRAFYRFDGSTWRETGRLQYTGGIQLRPWADPRGGAMYLASSNFGASRIEVASSSGGRVVSYQPAMRDLVMTSQTSGFAVGANYFLARLTGTQWNVDAPPAGTPTTQVLQGVWSDGPTNAWAVGQQSTIARWDGTRWAAVSDVRRPIVAQLDNYNAVWGAGGSVWIAGDAGIIRCRTATTCSQEQVPGAGVLYAIWGTSATNAFAVGAGGRILHFDGTAWTAMTSPTSGRLVRLWGNGPNNVWAAGDTVVLRYNGTAWKSATPEELQPSQNAFDSSVQGLKQIGLWGTTSGDVYLSTWFARILRYDGLMWNEVSAPIQDGIGIARIVAVAGAVNGCPLAITDGQSAVGGPTMMRGVGPTGCNATPLTGPASWP